jgi:hypothetical protein
VTDDLLFATVFDVSVGGKDASEARGGGADITEGTVLTFVGQGSVNIPLGVMFGAIERADGVL